MDNEQPALWPMSARALLLDLDGTLVDTAAAVESAWRSAADELGIPFATLAPYIHGIPGGQALELALPDLPAARRAAVLERILVAEAASTTPVGLVPGARDLLDALPDDGWAIVTSGDSRLATASMAKAGVRRPPVLVTADDVVRGKPEPEPYLVAARALGVAPADCLVIEDSPAGITSALRAGMRVLALHTTHSPDGVTAAHDQVADLTHVRVVAAQGTLTLHRAPTGAVAGRRQET
jgi:mannitol-1-/sugar-/sorbitol-6-phosphatase